MSISRPSCAGHHEPSATCDGGVDEPPCAFRARCLLLIRFAGGRLPTGQADPDALERVKRIYTDEDLERHALLAEEAANAAPRRRNRQGPARRKAAQEKAAKTAAAARKGASAPRSHPAAVLVIKKFVRKLADELERNVVGFGWGEPGDLFVRWTKAPQGAICELAVPWGQLRVPERRLMKFLFHTKDSDTSRLCLNTPMLVTCQQLDPPIGFDLRSVIDDGHHVVTTSNLTRANCDAVARWVARCYRAGVFRERAVKK